MVLSTLDHWSVGEGFYVPSGLQMLPYIFLSLKLLRQKRIKRRQPERQPPALSHDTSDHCKQSQLSFTSQYNLPWEGPFLICVFYQRSYLLLRGVEISHECVSILVVLPTEWQSASLETHMKTNTPICYWAWKSLKTFCQSCEHFVSECTCNLSDFIELCKTKIFLAVIYCPMILILITHISMVLLLKTFVNHLCLMPYIQPCLQRLPHTLPHCIATAWKIKSNFQELQTICILLVIVLLCTQLCAMVVCHSRTKCALSNGATIFFIFIFMCTLHLSRAHLTQREMNLATRHNSVIERHTRENGITSRTLTVRLTGGPNVGYCVTVAMGSVPQEVSQASAIMNKRVVTSVLNGCIVNS